MAYRYQYRDQPRTLAEVWEVNAKCSARLLSGKLQLEHATATKRAGEAARAAQRTLSRAKQLATLVDAANPGLWQKVTARRAPLQEERGLLLWIVAAAARDLHRAAYDKLLTQEVIDEIKQRQVNAVASVQAMSPSLGPDAARCLDPTLDEPRQSGPTPKVFKGAGASLRLG